MCMNWVWTFLERVFLETSTRRIFAEFQESAQVFPCDEIAESEDFKASTYPVGVTAVRELIHSTLKATAVQLLFLRR